MGLEVIRMSDSLMEKNVLLFAIVLKVYILMLPFIRFLRSFHGDASDVLLPAPLY
jgi:hypothetical protein